MLVTVKLYGTLRRFSQPGTPGMWQGNVAGGSTLQDLITLLGAPEGEVSVAAINGETVPFETPLPDGATVLLVTNVNGG
ncbi:MAG: MoaD/ThiS family protein [Chloroflexi bacterium]|nr:MoaD/ThiS family protein [Chloroflexota bacterium]